MTLTVAPSIATGSTLSMHQRGVALATTRQPTLVYPKAVSSPRDLKRTAQKAAERQMQVAGEGSPLRIVLGMDTIGAQVGPVWSSDGRGNGHIYIRCIWAGGGENVGVQSYTINDLAPPTTGVDVVHYTGAAGQGIDPWLAAAGLAQNPPIVYADTLPGIAYSVFKFSTSALTAPPTIKAVFKGLKLIDPNNPGDPATWSDNAGWALYNYLTQSWGENVTVSGGGAVADRCAELVGTAPNQEARCRIGLTLSQRQPAEQWRETLRTYAECFVVPDGGGYLLIPDAPAASEYTFDHASGTLAGSLIALGAIRRTGQANLPTVMTVWYTDRSVTPYRDAACDPVKRPGVDTGALPWRPQEIRLNGIFTKSQATRVATTRLNKLWLGDLSGEIHALDDAMRIRPGTVVTLSDPRGLVSKTVRVFGMSGVNGTYTLPFIEHDDAAYSDVVVGEPSSPDTPLPLPSEPPSVAGLTASEEVYQLQGMGVWASRIRATCTTSDYMYLSAYRWELWAGGGMVNSTITKTAEYVSHAVEEGVTYTVRAYLVSVVGASSETPTETTVTAQGKQLVPSDVSSFTGFEIGGEVRLTIGAATDLDLRFYEVRYADNATAPNAWADCTFVNATPAASGVGGFISSKNVPVGDWEFLCCALDSIGQYSATPARLSLTVTSDINAFMVDDIAYTSPTLTHMTAYTLGRTDAYQRWATDDGTAFGTAFGSALGTYSDLAQDSLASEWLSETHDFGQVLSGNWTADAGTELAAITGTVTQNLELSLDNVTWTQYPALTAKTSARYARYRIESAVNSSFRVGVPRVHIRIDAVAREENSDYLNPPTSSATGATTVTLAGSYSAVKSIVANPMGTSSLTAVIDNIVLGGTTSFDVYIFDGANTQVANAFNWSFKGV